MNTQFNAKLLLGVAVILGACQPLITKKEKVLYSQMDSTIDARWDQYIGHHELLPKPYTKALGEQKEFYYWDVYFINKGLLKHERYDLVKNNIDNLTFEIDTFGYVPNAPVSWGYSRSQPPFYSMMVREYYDTCPNKDKSWLIKAYNAALREYAFWNDMSDVVNGRNNSSIKGLQRYGYIADTTLLATVYEGISHRFPSLSEMTEDEKIKFGADIIAECGSGMDFTWRFKQRCTDFVAIDLNCNLYVYEVNFSWFEKELGLPTAADWSELAKQRKALINQYCWDNERGIFTDYDFINDQLNPVASMAMFWPLYWGIANQNQAEATLKALPVVESNWGIRATELVEAPHKLQWDGHAVWAPVQCMAYGGLKRYGFKKEAQKLAGKYLKLVGKNWEDPAPKSFKRNGKLQNREPGFIWEKYSVDGQISDADYASHEMMGWSAGVFVYFYHELFQN